MDLNQAIAALSEEEAKNLLTELVAALHEENTEKCYDILNSWDLEIHGECAVCGEPIAFGEDQSTYCGSMHVTCTREHAQHCTACARDFGDEDEEDQDR
jgi:hypothetical protein